MAKEKKETENKVVEPAQLYKYNIGDEVFTMENNKVKSFIVGKRIILTYSAGDGQEETKVYYDSDNWKILKAEYEESRLFPSKQKLLESL